MAKASDFKFGTQPGVAKANNKITPRWETSKTLVVSLYYVDYTVAA